MIELSEQIALGLGAVIVAVLGVFVTICSLYVIYRGGRQILAALTGRR